jgi:hypothetical protein
VRPGDSVLYQDRLPLKQISAGLVSCHLAELGSSVLFRHRHWTQAIVIKTVCVRGASTPNPLKFLRLGAADA